MEFIFKVCTVYPRESGYVLRKGLQENIPKDGIGTLNPIRSEGVWILTVDGRNPAHTWGCIKPL